MDNAKIIRAGAYFGGAAVVLLLMMAVIGAGAGETLGVLGQPDLQPPYGPSIKPGANTVVLVMALDSLFLIAYSGVFVGAAAAVWGRAAIFGITGLGFALLTTLLDMSENALTVSIAHKALADIEVSASLLTAVNVLGFVKYGAASVATAFFAAGLLISMPATRRVTQVTAVLLLLFSIVNAITIAFPSAGLLLILWMLVVLVGSTVFLWQVGEVDE